MQNILNKLHKFTSAQEPRKVEFGIDLAPYIKGASNYSIKVDSLISSLKSLEAKMEAIKKEMNAERNNLWFQVDVGESLANDTASDLNRFERGAKELGIDPNSSSDFVNALKAFREINAYTKKLRDYANSLKGKI